MNKEFPPFTQIIQVKILRIFMIKGRAIRKLVWEGGGGGGGGGGKGAKNQKKKNIHTGTPGNAKKYSCKGLKKKSYKGNFMRLENSHPHPHPHPQTFSSVPSLKL